MSKPSQAQIEAGNYKKRHVRFQGLDIAIENPKGSVRSGVDRGGKAWSIKMHADYGYVNGSMGVDGDQVDVFIGPQADAETVYIVTTMSPPNFIKRDENKCMLGYGSAAEAKSAFLAHYDDKRFFGSMLSMPVDEFKAKVLATKDKPAMIKAHVSGYRRDDGAYVRPYETKRPERKKRYPNKQTAQAMAVLDDIKDGRREALRELCGPKLDVLLVSIHASNKRVRDLVDQTSQPSESLADATLEALSGMQPEKLVRLHGWNDLIAHIRTTLRALVIYLRQTNMHAAADWLQWRVGEWTDEDIGRLLLRADAKLTKGMDMDAIGRMLGDFGKAAPTVLFLKAHVPQHTRVVNGRTVVVSSYDNKVVGGPKETRHKPDPFTLDLFGEAAGKQQDAEKLPTRDVRIGDELKIDGEIYHVTRGIKGGVLAERKVSAFQTSSRMLYGDDVIRAKIAAETHTMPKQEAIAEHERLVDVLNSPSHADDKVEAKKQAAELAEMKAPAFGDIRDAGDSRENKPTTDPLYLMEAPAEPVAEMRMNDHPAPIPRRTIASLSPEDYANWVMHHRAQHELTYYEMPQLQKRMDRVRSKKNQAETTMREQEKAEQDFMASGLPSSEDRAAQHRAAAQHARITRAGHVAELDRMAAMHQQIYESAAKHGKAKHKLLPESDDLRVDFMAMTRRDDAAEKKYAASAYKQYVDHYKEVDRKFKVKPLAKSARILFFKSHVAGYTRKDGVTVKPHEDNRTKAAEKDWRDEENWHTRTMGRMKTLSDDSLRYIYKDANEAASNMEKMNPNREKAGRYRDEAHYASMELRKRQEARKAS